MQSGFMMLRKPMPVARSIHWIPAGSNGADSASGADVPLFITQGALREAMRHLRSDPEQELMGFLLGNLFECPDTGSRYVVITSAMRTGHVIGETEPVQIPEEEWLGMQLELRRRRAGVMGWYHSAPFVGSSPARLDLETHRERFREPWQSGLVIATTGPEPTGGFFRLHPGGGLSGLLIPFDEIVEDDALLPGGRKRTLIDWANYRTEQPVEGDRSERRPHMPPPRRQSPDPVDPALAGLTAQPTLPVMLPEAALFEDDLPLPPMPEPRRFRFGAVAVLLLVIGAGAAGLWWWNHRGTIEPPAGLASGLFSSSPSTPAPAPNTRAADSALYAPPRDTAGLPTGGSMSSAPPAMAPANSTAVSTPPVRQPTSGGTANATTTAPPASQTAPTVTAAAPPAATPAPNAIAPSSNPRMQKFDALADSLEQAIRNFQDRAADFTTKRLTCRGLGVGYEGADDAYIALAGAYRTVHTSIDSAREARFRKLSSQIGDVNNTFDASKCPRP